MAPPNTHTTHFVRPITVYAPGISPLQVPVEVGALHDSHILSAIYRGIPTTAKQGAPIRESLEFAIPHGQEIPLYHAISSPPDTQRTLPLAALQPYTFRCLRFGRRF